MHPLSEKQRASQKCGAVYALARKLSICAVEIAAARYLHDAGLENAGS